MKVVLWLWDLLRATYYRWKDPNEDYICGHCGKKTRPRYLYCSAACAEQAEAN